MYRILLPAALLFASLAYADSSKLPELSHVADTLDVQGKVLVNRITAANWLRAYSNMPNYLYDSVRTEEKSSARIAFLEGSRIQIGSATELLLQKGAEATQKGSSGKLRRLLLRSGLFWARIRSGRGARYEFEVPRATLGVRGTELLVDAAKKEETVIYIFEGEVAVRSKQGEKAFGAGTEIRLTDQEMIVHIRSGWEMMDVRLKISERHPELGMKSLMGELAEIAVMSARSSGSSQEVSERLMAIQNDPEKRKALETLMEELQKGQNSGRLKVRPLSPPEKTPFARPVFGWEPFEGADFYEVILYEGSRGDFDAYLREVGRRQSERIRPDMSFDEMQGVSRSVKEEVRKEMGSRFPRELFRNTTSRNYLFYPKGSPPLASGKKYSWEVMAMRFGSRWSFPMGRVDLELDPSGKTEPYVPGRTSARNPGYFPSFSWGEVPGATSYLLRIGADEDLFSGDADLFLEARVKGMDFRYPPEARPLQSGASYAWAVIPLDDQGIPKYTPEKAERFVVPKAQTVGPRPLYPHGEIESGALFFDWIPVAGARGYQVSILDHGKPLKRIRTGLPPLVPTALLPGGSDLTWKIEALDDRGRVLGSGSAEVPFLIR